MDTRSATCQADSPLLGAALRRPIADEYQPRVGCLRQDVRHRAQDPMVALEALKPANGHKQRTAVLFLRRRVDR